MFLTGKTCNMRVIGTKAHGFLDYIVGVLLIAAPWIFGFYQGGAESWVPIGLGVMTIIYSLFTKYELGAVPSLNMSTHLTLDVMSGLLLGLSPILMNFHDVVWVPHVVVGIFEVIVASISKIIPAEHSRSFGRI
jgi:hypothetical protein